MADSVSSQYSSANDAFNTAVGCIAATSWPIKYAYVLSDVATLIGSKDGVLGESAVVLAGALALMTEEAFASVLKMAQTRSLALRVKEEIGEAEDISPQAAARWLRSQDASSPAVVLLSAAVEGYATGGRKLRELADQGNVAAMVLLGRLLEDGRGTTKDTLGAASLYRRAAEAGYLCGAYNLAHKLFYGTGIAQDKVEALLWLRKAAEAGHREAMNGVGYCYQEGWGGLDKDLTQAVAWYRRAAEAGSAVGAFNLAMKLDNGTGIAQDTVEALRWLRKAAEAGYGEAMNGLGRSYKEGWGGLDKDPAQALVWYRRAAEAGSAVGAFNLALMLHNESGIAQDKVEALRWLRKAAEAGHGEAMNRVGFYYREGLGGLDKDPAQAVAWFRRAAEAGSANGANNLARILHDGTGVAQDQVEALRWFRKAAEAGHREAMNMVGRYYQEGWGGLGKDPAQALVWFRKEAEAGGAAGAYNLAQKLHDGTGIAQDKVEALRWFRKAAEAGHSAAMNMVGRYYGEGGGGLGKDPAKEVVWYRRAAESGSVVGAYNLAMKLDNGTGIAQDRVEALRWLRKAAEAGYGDPMNMVGRYYEEGWGGLDKDPAQAVAWFRRAAEAGSVFGAHNLARFLNNGTGIAQDQVEALRWFRKAAEAGDGDAMNMVGRFYDEGWGGLDKDPAQAVVWYRRAAESGSASGAFNLASKLQHGSGIAEDTVEALRWLRKAAEAGYGEAMNGLGRSYKKGLGGLDKDPTQAVAWFRKAAEQNNISGMTNLGILLTEGAQSLPKDTETAAYWLRRASELGQKNATAWLASLHQQGVPGVVQSLTEAKRLYAIAAEGGIAWAKERLLTLPEAKATEIPPPPAVRYDSRFKKLDALRGLGPVKTKLREFANTMDLARKRKALGYRSTMPTAHMLFMGNPGTGKTTVARILGELLRSIGVLSRGHVVEVDRSKLVQVYIGETEKKTAEFIAEAMGGILFVDEAHNLAPPDNPRDVGPMAIQTILKAMEDQRDQFVVIFAGYEKQMKENLLAVDPGLPSRIPHEVFFPDYDVADLTSIAMDFIHKSHGFGWEGGVEQRVRELIQDRFVPIPQDFANARSVRNLVDEIITRRAQRPGGDVTRLTVADIPAVAPKASRPDPLKELHGMIGLQEAKQQVQQWATRLIMAKKRRDQGYPVEVRANHMIFTGAPGTGKTVVARLIARILVENGMLQRDVVVEKVGTDLKGQYQGQTAPKVQKAFEEADGGVLFIDEAYALYQENRDSFGQEAVNALLPLLENKRDRVVVILAGYANEIDRFLQDANPGLRSRFPVRINFHDYTTPEMIQIFEKFLFEKGFHFGKGARQQAEKIIADRSRFPNFGNARGVRNLVDETLSRTDERLQRSNGSEDLMEVCSEDIPH